MIKGFVLDDERLKQGETLLGKDYNDTIAFEKGMISTTTFGKKLLSSIFE